MLIWFILSLLVILSSLVLTIRSMSEYQEKLTNFKKSYGVFLIQNPGALTIELLTKLHQKLVKDKAIISLERLFKGEDSQALILVAPKELAEPLTEELKLLELEDYALEVTDPQLLIWEVSFRTNNKQLLLNPINQQDLGLGIEEQFWWQLVLEPENQSLAEGVYKWLQQTLGKQFAPKKTNRSQEAKSGPGFAACLRLAIKASDEKRRVELQKQTFLIGKDQGLKALPSGYKISDKLKFYQQRALPLRLGIYASLTPKEVLSFLGLLV